MPSQAVQNKTTKLFLQGHLLSLQQHSLPHCSSLFLLSTPHCCSLSTLNTQTDYSLWHRYPWDGFLQIHFTRDSSPNPLKWRKVQLTPFSISPWFILHTPLPSADKSTSIQLFSFNYLYSSAKFKFYNNFLFILSQYLIQSPTHNRCLTELDNWCGEYYFFFIQWSMDI